MERRYRALRIISGIYRVLGGLAIILAVVGAALALLAPNLLTTVSLNAPPPGSDITARLLVAGSILLPGLLSGLTLFAIGQFIQLMLATEENTRLTALLLQRMSRRREQ